MSAHGKAAVTPLKRVLIANRGEIVERIARTAAEMGIETVGVLERTDQGGLHHRAVDSVRELPGRGVAAFLDAQALVDIAVSAGCDAVHPGYGFLSEDSRFARLVRQAGLVFVGPTAEQLALFGDKADSRALARRCGVPVLAGTPAGVTLAEASAFWDTLPPGHGLMVKAVAGGGGRGTREVTDRAALAEAFARCESEATAAFGDGRLYLEARLVGARHIEVQVVGDGSGAVQTLGERDCSLQRRHQKLIEIAPAPNLAPALRDDLRRYALAMASAVRYRGVGTWEFLVVPDGDSAGSATFLETNARLQVEHTVTEQSWGVDLVRAQLELASGASLAELRLPDPAGGDVADGWAIQCRILAETIEPDGTVRPSGGTVTSIGLPAGPGIRVDHALGAGVRPDPRFDSLLAKLIVHVRQPELSTAVRITRRALAQTSVSGIRTNLAFLRALLADPRVGTGRATTDLVDTGLAGFLEQAASIPVQTSDGVGEVVARAPDERELNLPSDVEILRAAMNATTVTVAVGEGDEVRAGQQLVVLESMKMEHPVTAPVAGVVAAVLTAPGDVVGEGGPLVAIRPVGAAAVGDEPDEMDLDAIRPDLARVLDRHERLLDVRRPEAVARRHRIGRRTARENVDDLLDDGSLIEYGGLAIAAQRGRRDYEDLVERTPADGMIGGIGTVDGERCVVASYDYTVLAGTQGHHNHLKKDRLFDVAGRQGLPVVLFAEGGGGRPGDTDYPTASGLAVTTFTTLARLSGTVPLVGIASGRCFAGNAALLGACDVIIATEDSNIGMGGPVMIEGGGLGRFAPEDIGPIEVQDGNGVVDIRVTDDASAVAAARKYLSYFTTSVTAGWRAPDARLLRHVIPEERKRVYDIRRVLEGLADIDSILELRAGWADGMVTALARVEGRAVGIVANNPKHLGGAIDTPSADKASRFMQLCDAFGVPLLFLCDTPGFMVGPESETTATVRHFGRMFVTGANLDVPLGTIVLRKAYGLGAQAMAGGGFKAPLFTIGWPTAELGPMGLEGAVRLSHRREMDAISDPAERQRYYEAAVRELYELGSGMHVAEQFEIDDVIDPADSRRWVAGLLRPATPRAKRRPFIDAW